jgi:RNA polymerase sigma factor (sigma-70 family)
LSRCAGAVLEQLNRVFNHGTVIGLPEGKLLERFVAEGDETAFAALVTRHGPMVLGVCRRILRDDHAVEDAFQATFLILVRRAGAIKNGEQVGHWLHGVAHRVAARARAQAAYRSAHETTSQKVVELRPDSADDEVGRRDMRAVLDEELARLPNSLRSPVVLCYLEGLTHDEAAAQLRWPVGTVRSRMARARDLLRERLVRRGFATDGAALSAALASQPVPVTLIDSTVQASLAFATKQATAASVVSAAVTTLAEGVLHTMMISNFKILGAAALAGVLAIGGARTMARQFGAMSADPQSAPSASKASDRRTDLLKSVDKIDDLLDDVERRNRDLQTELRALRKEIVALRSAELNSIGTIASHPTSERKGVDVRNTSSAQRIADQSAEPTESQEGQSERARPEGQLDPGPTQSERAVNVSRFDPGPTYFRSDQFFVIVSSHGDKVALYHGAGWESQPLRLSDGKRTKQTVTPRFSGGLMALRIKGPKVSRIAVSTADGTWYPQDLREPVEFAEPIMEKNGIIAYVLGRYVYAFGALGATPRWDVLELPAGSHPRLTVDANGLTVGHGDHIYLFNGASGQWSDIDTNAIFDAPQGKETEEGRE